MNGDDDSYVARAMKPYKVAVFKNEMSSTSQYLMYHIYYFN